MSNQRKICIGHMGFMIWLILVESSEVDTIFVLIYLIYLEKLIFKHICEILRYFRNTRRTCDGAEFWGDPELMFMKSLKISHTLWGVIMGCSWMRRKMPNKSKCSKFIPFIRIPSNIFCYYIDFTIFLPHPTNQNTIFVSFFL